MKIGLIDVDAESRGSVTFPNLALMKISAWHKARGDHVEWYSPLLSTHMDRVYMSRVFGDEYTADYPYHIDADEVIRGGSGYAIEVVGDREEYNPDLDKPLPNEIEHMYPDYSIYGITDAAYGFLTKGCPRGCAFCHVAKMQGRKVRDHAKLSEWWDGQKRIVLLDPNLTAHKNAIHHLKTLAATGAEVDFTQGLDLRMMTPDIIDALNLVKWKRIHFAWDNPQDDLKDKLVTVMAGLHKANKRNVTVYILTNYDSTHEQDLYRVMQVRAAGAQPYVMIYRKPTAPKVTRKLARWANAPNIFWSCATFEEYGG